MRIERNLNTLAHDKVMALERGIKAALPDIYDIVIHIEPEGDVEQHERFGLNETHLEE